MCCDLARSQVLAANCLGETAGWRSVDDTLPLTTIREMRKKEAREKETEKRRRKKDGFRIAKVRGVGGTGKTSKI